MGINYRLRDKALVKLKATVKQLSRRTRGHSVIQVIAALRKSLLGWKAYFDIAEILSPLRDLDKWIRRRLRSLYLEAVGTQRLSNAQAAGCRPMAGMEYGQIGPWRLSGSLALGYALPNRYFKNLGLPELAAR